MIFPDSDFQRGLSTLDLERWTASMLLVTRYSFHYPLLTTHYALPYQYVTVPVMEFSIVFTVAPWTGTYPPLLGVHR